jgi:hypothetical protein
VANCEATFPAANVSVGIKIEIIKGRFIGLPEAKMHCCISFSSHSSRQHKWIASRIFSKNSCREEKLCFQVNPHAQSMPAMVEARLSAPFVFLADEARMTSSSFF